MRQLFSVLLLLSVCFSATAQDKLRVGVLPHEPLSVAASDGFYQGLAVELWESVAERGDYLYDYVDVERGDGRAALANGKVDIILTATPLTGTRDTLLHSPIYYSSNFAVGSRNKSGMLEVVSGLFQPAFFKILVGLSILLLIVGTIIYFVERKPNEDEFGGKMHEGIGAGFWWAGVTLTTIGYGDKAPVSFWGRVVAMLWMIVGLAVSATLTAAIVSLATDNSSSLSLPADLKETVNVVPTNHFVISFLDRQQIPYVEVPDIETAFARVEAKEADHVLANEIDLRYYQDQNGKDFSIQATRFSPNYFAMGFRQNLAQADTLSVLVNEVMASTAWTDWIKEFVPK